MLLTNLTLKNYRCFSKVELSVSGRLAILIGENDCGKTVLLDAIELLLSKPNCQTDDFQKSCNGRSAPEMALIGEFQLEAHDTLPDEYRCGPRKDKLILKRTFTASTAKTSVVGRSFNDSRFDDANFTGADSQKELLKEFGLKPASKEAERKAQRNELVDAGKLTGKGRLNRVAWLCTSYLTHAPSGENIVCRISFARSNGATHTPGCGR